VAEVAGGDADGHRGARLARLVARLQLVVFTALVGPVPDLVVAGLAGQHVDTLGDHERGQQADAELADGVHRALVVGKLGAGLAGAGAADHGQQFFDVVAVHAAAVVREADLVGVAVAVDADLAAAGARLGAAA